MKADVRMLLEAIQWNGHQDLFQCPSCGASQVAGHERTCRLTQILESIKRPANLL